MNKRIKNLLILTSVVLLTLTSCKGFDNEQCYKSVQDYFPNAKTIFVPPDYNYTFIVVDSSSTVWYVQTANVSDVSVTSTLRIYKPK